LYLQDKDFHLFQEVHQFVPDALSRLCENNMPARLEQVDDIPGSEIRLPRQNLNCGNVGHIGALQTKLHIPKEIYFKIAAVHNSTMGHWGLVQRIMNTVEKTSAGITPAELILNN